MKKRLIINIILIVSFIISIFFLIRYDVMGKLYDLKNLQFSQNKSQSENNAHRELKYETVLDKDGNEIVIEMEKIILEDEEGNEVEMYVDTSEAKVIYYYSYKGKIKKIEDNKIYFIVDQKTQEGTGHIFENVKDYKIVFDIDTYNLDFNPNDASYQVNDCLSYGSKELYKAEDLKDVIDKYLRLTDALLEDYYTGIEYKSLIFYEN